MNLFISHLGLKGPLGTPNQQSSCVTTIFFYRTLNQHPTRSIRGYEKSYSWSASFPKCKFFFEFFFKPLSYVYRVSVLWLNPPGRAPW